MKQISKTENQSIGKRGEDVAAEYLVSKGFHIIERNVHRRWGEIDIVAEKGGMLVCVEVKALVADKHQELRPEDHLTKKKLARFARACRMYVGSAEGSYRLDVIAIEFSVNGKVKELRHLEAVEV